MRQFATRPWSEFHLRLGLLSWTADLGAASYNGGVIAGHSRPKDGVASLAYARKRRDPAIHERVQRRQS
jgi:hypothetical protein